MQLLFLNVTITAHLENNWNWPRNLSDNEEFTLASQILCLRSVTTKHRIFHQRRKIWMVMGHCSIPANIQNFEISSK